MTILIILVSLLFFISLVILFILLKPFIFLFISSKLRRSSYDKLGKSSQIRLINQLRESVEYLSKNKIGALITIENNDNIDNLRTDGVILDANISSGLLISIFNKYSPLHDGAVVIRNNKIYYAATFYKITRRSAPASYGSRHRAAMGISEQCDATTIVVSEENGGVRILKGNLVQQVKIEEFQEQLIKYLKE
ncbi:DNA integrity scanning protein DisA nucleotide-binding domain protein [Mycoplasmopsis cynos]|uniref:DAC domain-containing protein n=2 Tax=Mycoplasmopsis cynos TaxID=171284 RepID=L0RXD2_MYCC1|nr:DNA integrity scanning protein DisA nucleotide-binding domain protein [Mycoplasmopsis cynos]TQC55085.1 diadenylate cyclase [Mycoplasmopsis cynos]WQQ12810.1 DNA integrity scanning protein DisA nucleotide-binding domain protein [Mycoplasmopsis cynos]WQQ14019.1 DNA integrity scanning protein DisA nucleotide-binding domain protein [Mycoplasmopsis cynos]WQQ14918.1 DNA integrity scanning protein DisA nucleotide-binding domain protein [Mycoplasmopsis cynos]WQQ15570.1 DNA integrity scanning protein